MSAPAEEQAVLGAAGDLDDALGREVLDLGGRGLVAEGAAAQLPGAVAAPAVHAVLCHRCCVRPARCYRPHILHACITYEPLAQNRLLLGRRSLDLVRRSCVSSSETAWFAEVTTGKVMVSREQRAS